VEWIEFQLHLGEVGVADDQALGVRVGVDLRAHLQSAVRLGVGGWRQLPWRRDDNYLGGLNTGAGPVREAGLS
jgi:hypothetical protein